ATPFKTCVSSQPPVDWETDQVASACRQQTPRLFLPYIRPCRKSQIRVDPRLSWLPGHQLRRRLALQHLAILQHAQSGKPMEQFIWLKQIFGIAWAAWDLH